MVVAALLLMQTLQLVLRPRNWILDVEWTISNYLASMVLYGPLVCFLAAWIGAQDAKSAWIFRINLYRTPVIRSLRFTVIAVAVFLSILIGIVAFVPPWDGQSITSEHLGGVGISCIAIAGYSFFGWAWGYRHGTSWTWSLAVVISFVVTLGLWINGFESVIRFDLGMAGPYLVAYNHPAELLRVSTWLLVIGISILYSVNLRVDGHTKAVNLCLTLSLVLLLITSLHTKTFVSRSEKWVCDSDRIEVCVLEQNQRFLDEVDRFVRKSAIAMQLSSMDKTSKSIKIDVIHPNLINGSSVDAELVSKYLAMAWPLCKSQQVDLFSLPPRQIDRVSQLHEWIFASVAPNYKQQTKLDSSLPKFPIGDPNALLELQTRLKVLPSC